MSATIYQTENSAFLQYCNETSRCQYSIVLKSLADICVVDISEQNLKFQEDSHMLPELFHLEYALLYLNLVS
jgi:hypothetical protein